MHGAQNGVKDSSNAIVNWEMKATMPYTFSETKK
jgi:hypothetical protein